ncbi:MAG: flavodoxin family protein [Desulfobacteraceae bacterium]|nr:flavodoxin family protein [Desulfobacteraceae bacterium]
MSRIVAIYGSPRRKGNTARLLAEAVAGARQNGAQVEEVVLRDLKISPCLEIYACRQDGECAIKDDFQAVREAVLSARGLMLATPIFFYTVSSHVKMFIDRCQSLWVKKYWIEGAAFGLREPARRGLLISAGATKGKRLFEGTLLSMKYFFDVFDAQLWDSLLYRGLDFEGDVLEFPEYLSEAREAGRRLAGECSRLE